MFSTIKVLGGVLFAWERHYARMERDAHLLRVPFPPDADRLRAGLLRLVEANGAADATLRVAIVRNRGGVWQGPVAREFDVIALTTDLKDWGRCVRLAVAAQARHAASPFRGVKMLSWANNLVLLEQAQARGFDEVILLNEREEVSECTSANLFAAIGGEILTPPLDSGCLPGVTRELLLAEARGGVAVREGALKVADLCSADQVFITSTTRDLLAVSEIEGRAIADRGEMRQKLQAAFNRYEEQYIAGRQAQVPPVR